jgi:pyridinium-3,5-biscarboxylic acid mononucleotide sulfurtransferase
MTIAEKKTALENLIASCGSILVSFSGGVDSALLAFVARNVLGGRSHSVFLDSPLVPRSEVDDAKILAGKLGVSLDIVDVSLMEHEIIRNNPHDRCYHCKKIMARVLKDMATTYHLACIADGMNLSDLDEHRPGLIAATEEGIMHPFIMTGITKEDIRQIAYDYGLEVWNKPSAACLASRIPYGDEITTVKLRMIEQAETFLAGKGFIQFRVRLHGRVARIEIPPADFERLLAVREEIIQYYREIGIFYITLDLAGYRSGSMDEVI